MSTKLAVREIAGHLTLTGRAITAWYLVPPVAWAWKGDAHCEDVLTNASQAWAGVTGRDTHTRVTSRPYPAGRWAKALSDNTPNPTDPEAFSEYLRNTQKHLHRSTLADTEVYVGVEITERSVGDRFASLLGRGGANRRRISEILTEVEEAVGHAGFNARPVDQDELEWLMHRSVGLGLPEPVDLAPSNTPLGEDDIATFYDSVDVGPRPGRRSIAITGHSHRNGVEVTRYVTVLSMGRMESLDIPGAHDPWVAYAERLPFGVEFSIRAQHLDGEAAAAAVRSRLDLIRDQDEQVERNSLDRPPVLDRVRGRARSMRDEMEEGTELQGARVPCWVRMAVSGSTEKEVEERARALVKHYRGLHQTKVERPGGQHGLYREFIPGEALATTSHRRVMPVRYFAAGLPQMAATVGDRQGHYLGYTAGTARRGVTWDPHLAMEVRETSGFSPVVGGLGSGKSVFMAAQAHVFNLRGVSTTVLDPAGPMSRIPGARVINLMDSSPGTLSPYFVVPDPRRETYRDDPEVRRLTHNIDRDAKAEELYERAVVGARKTRQQMAMDLCRLLLPMEVRGGGDAVGRATRVAVGQAVRSVEAVHTASLGSVLDHLRRGDEHAREIAAILMDMSEWPQCRLFFGSGYLNGEKPPADGLVVITMPGLSWPIEGSAESTWGEAERIALPLLTGAAHYAARRVYDLPMGERKAMILDEAHRFRHSAAGRAFFDELARNITRKWNTRVLAGTQRPLDMIDLDVQGLTSETFIGRIEDRAIAADALNLAGIPTGVGYEPIIGTLSPSDTTRQVRTGFREFVFRDVDRNVERVRIDLDHLPGFVEALNTTPGSVGVGTGLNGFVGVLEASR